MIPSSPLVVAENPFFKKNSNWYALHPVVLCGKHKLGGGRGADILYHSGRGGGAVPLNALGGNGLAVEMRSGWW